MIAVMICTRGMIFGQTIASISKNLKSLNHQIITVIGLPIPDAQNEAVKRALKTPATHFLSVEEDMDIPDNVVRRMLELNKDIVALDYPVDSGHSTIQRKEGKIIFCGLGCTLFNRRVFKKMSPPWFETSKSLRIVSTKPFEYVVDDIPYKYGGLDNYFCHKARELGFDIHDVDGEAKHLRLIKADDRMYNKGTQIIEPLPPISKHINY
jgi:hypothetical protein